MCVSSLGAAGPSVILIAGAAGGTAVFEPVVQRLKTRLRLHIIEVFGFAGLPAPRPGPLLSPVATEIAAFGAQIGPHLVVGHSWGGAVALALASTSSAPNLGGVLLADAVPALADFVLANDAQTSRETEIERFLAWTEPVSDETFANRMLQALSTMFVSPESFRAVAAEAALSDRETVRHALRELLETDLRPRLNSIKVPVHLVVSAWPSLEVPAVQTQHERYRRQFDDLPRFSMECIDQTRHFMMHDAPDRFAEIVLHWATLVDGTG